MRLFEVNPQAERQGWAVRLSVPVEGDGIQAPGAVVLCWVKGAHPYAVHFFNAQDGGFHNGSYHAKLEDAIVAFEARAARFGSIEAHSLFTIWRPDEVAECLEGVGNTELYGKLWSFVKDYKGPEPAEAEEPTPGIDCLADFWDRLSIAEKAKLNELALNHDKEFMENE